MLKQNITIKSENKALLIKYNNDLKTSSKKYCPSEQIGTKGNYLSRSKTLSDSIHIKDFFSVFRWNPAHGKYFTLLQFKWVLLWLKLPKNVD